MLLLHSDWHELLQPSFRLGMRLGRSVDHSSAFSLPWSALGWCCEVFFFFFWKKHYSLKAFIYGVISCLIESCPIYLSCLNFDVFLALMMLAGRLFELC